MNVEPNGLVHSDAAEAVGDAGTSGVADATVFAFCVGEAVAGVFFTDSPPQADKATAVRAMAMSERRIAQNVPTITPRRHEPSKGSAEL